MPRASGAIISPARPAVGRLVLSPGQVAQTRNRAAWVTETRSLLDVRRRLHHGEWLWHEQGVPPGPAAIQIDLATQLLSVMRGGHEIGTAVILFGANRHATPTGRFRVLARSAEYRSKAYDADMPYAMRLTVDGVAIHASNVRPGSATHGCIGVPVEFARRLFGAVRVGDEVLIVRS